MPRPGPRPYECVRRAWHSDRHQPMRGSLIREIFRIANEIHSPASKRNKEWQEKLPIVVLKAEEIMYSKANSEAEYMDLNTLWDRVNDAINTIIRRDEESETGDYLQPCIEAALNLGCIPRRASRSQRHSNPRSYLNPSAQDQPNSANLRVPDKTTHEGSLPLQSANRTNSPQLIPRFSTFTTPITVCPTGFRSKSTSPVTPDSNPTSTQEFPFSSEKFPSTGFNESLPIPASSASNIGRVVPLYYGFPFQSREPQLSLQVQAPRKPDHETIVGIPCVQSSMVPAAMPVLEYPFSCEAGVSASDRTTQSQQFKDKSEKRPQVDCDLHLRLGPPVSGVRAENEWPRQVEDVDSSSSLEGSKSNDQSPQTGRQQLCFLPRDNPDDPLNLCSSILRYEGEGLNAEAIDRKRKAPVSESVGDGNTRKQSKFPSNQFLARLRQPGL